MSMLLSDERGIFCWWHFVRNGEHIAGDSYSRIFMDMREG